MTAATIAKESGSLSSINAVNKAVEMHLSACRINGFLVCCMLGIQNLTSLTFYVVRKEIA
jgi:hypothetical protein